MGSVMWGSGSGVGVSSVCVLVCPVTFTGLLSAGPEDLGVLFFRFARRGPGLASMHPLRRLHRTNSADHPESAISPSVGVKLQQAVPPSDANGVQAPAKHWAIPRAWHRKKGICSPGRSDGVSMLAPAPDPSKTLTWGPWEGPWFGLSLSIRQMNCLHLVGYFPFFSQKQFAPIHR